MKAVVDLVNSPNFFECLSRMGIEEMGIRRQAREVALQALYMMDFNDEWSESALHMFYDQFGVDSKHTEFSELLVLGVIKNKQKLDSVITRASENWSIQRMSKVDRSLLRLACFELCCLPEIPSNVSINEAIEISKRFGSEDSPMFINGVLDKISSYIDIVTSQNSDSNDFSTNDQVKKAIA